MQKTSSEKGYALIFVLVVMATLAILGASMAMAVDQETLLTSKEANEKKARNIAEAGIEHAIAKLSTNRLYTGETKTFGQGKFTVAVTRNGKQYTVVSNGAYPETGPQITKKITTVIEFPANLEYVAMAETGEGIGSPYAIDIKAENYWFHERWGLNITVDGKIHGNSGVSIVETYRDHGWFSGHGNTNAKGDIGYTANTQVGRASGKSIDFQSLPTANTYYDEIQFPDFDFDKARSDAQDSGTYVNSEGDKIYLTIDGDDLVITDESTGYWGHHGRWRKNAFSVPNDQKLIFVDGDLEIRQMFWSRWWKRNNQDRPWTIVVNGSIHIVGELGDDRNNDPAQQNLIAKNNIYLNSGKRWDFWSMLNGAIFGVNLKGLLYSQDGCITSDPPPGEHRSYGFSKLELNGTIAAKKGIKVRSMSWAALSGPMTLKYDPSAVENVEYVGGAFSKIKRLEWREE